MMPLDMAYRCDETSATLFTVETLKANGMEDCINN